MRDFDPATVPVDQIHVVIAQLSAWQSQLIARLMATPSAPAASNQTSGIEPLLDAKQLAQHLGVHESKVRTEQRAGRYRETQERSSGRRLQASDHHGDHPDMRRYIPVLGPPGRVQCQPG